MRKAKRHRERGTVLLLMPAAVLVLLILGAIAVDSAIGFMAQRNLVAAAGDASNDAASLALDRTQLLGGGHVRLQRDEVARSVDYVLRRDGINDATIDEVTVTADGQSARVRIHRTVHLVFAPIVPGVAHTTTVRATVEVTNVSR